MKSKKHLAVILSILLSFPSAQVFALEPQSENTLEPAVIIEVQNEQEYEQLVNEIEAHNAYVSTLWEEALVKSETTPPYSSGNYTTYGVYSTTDTATMKHSSGWNTSIVYANVVYDRIDNGSYYIFGDVYGFRTWPHGSAPLSNVITNYARIDQNRVLAVNYAYVIGILTGGIYINHDVMDYVEYNANGGCVVY